MYLINGVCFKSILNTVKFVLLSFLLLSLGACGVEDLSLNPASAKFLYVTNPNIPDKKIDRRFTPIINQFVRDAKKYGLNAQKPAKNLRQVLFFEGLLDGQIPNIKGYRNENKSLAGFCIAWQEINSITRNRVETHYIIFFDASYQDKIDSYEFKAIAYHELSHCLFKAVHTSLPDKDFVLSAKDRMSAYLKTESQSGNMKRIDPKELRVEDVPPEGLVAFNGYYYSKSLIEELKVRFAKEYNDEMILNNHIMNEFMAGDEAFWGQNWDFMANELFTSLGGVLPTARTTIIE